MAKELTGGSNPFKKAGTQYAKDQKAIKKLDLERELKLKKQKSKKTANKEKEKKSIQVRFTYSGSSKGEKAIMQYLSLRDIDFEPEKELQGMFGRNGSKLRLDFYLPLERIAIEFDGVQHFKASKVFDTPTCTLETRQRNDRLKDDFCARKGIKMIRISYKQINQITSILNELIR